MRVLYFHQHFATPRGASGTRSYEMAQRLIRAGHQVTLVCGCSRHSATGLEGPVRRGMRRGWVDGIDVIELALPYSNYDGFAKRACTFLRFAARSVGLALFEKCDLIFATSTPLTAGIPGVFARLLRRKPFVFEVRDLWPELPRAMGVITNPAVLGAMSLLEWVTYRTADAAIGLSPGIVEGIRRRSQAGKPVFLIPNGCDLELFTPDGGDRGLVPGLEPDDFVAVFTGAHGMANGLDAVLDAAVQLQSMGERHIKLVFVGDGKLKPRLVQRAREEKLASCIFADPMPKQELARFLAAADLGLMILANVPAFYYGTSPNKFFDYIASGLPVLVNYPGWLADLIREHGCGRAVPPGDPKAFAQALVELRDDASARDDMRQRARRLAESTFSREAQAELFIGALRDTLSRSGKAAEP